MNDIKVKLTRILLSTRPRKSTNKQIRFWDLPVTVDERDARCLLEVKFDLITDYSYSWKAQYVTIRVEFQKENVAAHILEHKSQTVGKYCLRVTPPDWTNQ